MAHRAGYVNIIGRPNVGKSTLLNALLGEKLVIVNPKAQTTRHRILGILNGDDHQLVLSDTPGILEPAYKLQESMMHAVDEALRDADVLILDSQYDKAEDKKHIGWGHGCVDDSVALALLAGVEKLYLFHHDLDHDDRRIDGLLKHARKLVAKRKASLKVEAAREGNMIQFAGRL